MSGLGHGAEARNQESYEREDADLGGLLKGGGKAEDDELADPIQVGLHGSLEQFGFVARVVPQEINNENQREVAAGDAGGDAGAGDAVCGNTESAKDQKVIAKEVDEVCGNEREGDRTDHVHALKCAADSEVEEQRHKAGREGPHVGSGKDGNGVSYAEALEVIGDDPDGNGEEWGDGEAQIDAVDQGGVAVFAAACTKGLGDERVQADEKPFAKEGKDDEDAGADADGSDGFGTVGEATDHHGVDDDHAHPADFRKDEGQGQVKRGTEFGTEDGEEGHGECQFSVSSHKF